MPNHCHNDVYIRGDAAQLAQCLALIGADRPAPAFDFNAVIPYPAEFAERDAESHVLGYEKFREKYGPNAKDGFNSGGIEWRYEKWGTKWNACDVARRDYDGVCVTFQTAWSPPIPVIAALHAKFPKLSISIEYFEMGAAFSGGVTFASTDDAGEACMAQQEWRGAYGGQRGG